MTEICAEEAEVIIKDYLLNKRIFCGLILNSELLLVFVYTSSIMGWEAVRMCGEYQKKILNQPNY